MTNSYQKAAFRRKLTYFGLVVVLFVSSIFVRGLVGMPNELKKDVGQWTIREQSDRLDLNELNRGEVELSGSAIRLLLTGSRGFVVCALWISAQEIQVRQEWHKLELTVKNVTMLQPHFITPWLFQSWNLAYNVSVEMDRLNDMYFYIAHGISLLAQGEAINRNNPEIRYGLATYYQNKFTVSDKVTTLRSLFELSCIPKGERDYRKLMKGGEVDLVAFKAFCEKNPQLVRRLRETAIPLGRGANGEDLPRQFLVKNPLDVVYFLRDNESLPNRFRDDEPDRLEDRMRQFPVLPPPEYEGAAAELKPESIIPEGQASAVRVARAWYRYADEAILLPCKEPAEETADPTGKRRRPKQPMMIIFRQGPMRAQSFVAEQTEKEGWFDSDPWIVDENRDSNDRWFEEDVVIKPTTNAKEEWTLAHTAWDQHGRANGLIKDPAELEHYKEVSQLYFKKHPAQLEDEDPQLRADDQKDMAESARAAKNLQRYDMNRQLTNFSFFLFQSELESRKETIDARKLFFKAEKAWRRADNTSAIALYKKAFGTPEDPGLWRTFFLMVRRNRANYEKYLDKVEEDTYEQQMQYTRLLKTVDDQLYRQAPVALLDVTRLCTPSLLPMLDLNLQQQHVSAMENIEPIWPPGPFDGNDPEGNPWIPPTIKDRVRMNMNLVKPVKPPPKNDSKP